MEKEVLSVEALQAMRGKLAREISASALDFVETYEATNSAYFCDAFQEFADSQTSSYCADQRRYYEEHSGVCKAGAVGEYRSIENDLYNDFEKIKIILALDYIIEHGLLFNEERLSDLMLDLEDIDQLEHTYAVRYTIENNLE